MLPFLDRFRRRDVVGMDLGSASIKMVRVRPSQAQQVATVSEWFYPLSSPEGWEKEIPKLKSFLKTQGLSGARIACNVEESLVKTRKVDLPKMPESDLREAVRWQLRDAVEGAVADYIIRYSPLGEGFADGKKNSYLTYAIKKTIIQKLLDFLRRLGLSPVFIEPTSVSLLAVFDTIHGWRKEEYYGLVGLGESQAHFSVMSDAKLLFSRSLTGISGKELRLVLERDLGLKTEESADFKKFLTGGQLTIARLEELKERAMDLLPDFYTRIAIETQKAIDAFSLTFHKDKIHYLFLCGGLAGLSNLSESLARNLAVPTKLLNPGEKFKMSEGPSPHIYDIALGLALDPL